MSLFAFETSQDDGFVRNLGFIDEIGKLVIEQKFSWSAYSHFNKHEYCVVNTDVNWSQAVINNEGSTLLTLPKGYFNFVMSPPDAHGIFPVEHRLDSEDPMTARTLGPASQTSHLRACKRFAAWLGHSPETATPDDVKYFQQHLHAQADHDGCQISVPRDPAAA